jgi:hypothetical protein
VLGRRVDAGALAPAAMRALGSSGTTIDFMLTLRCAAVTAAVA